MYKATREFIKLRQPHTIYKLDVVVVKKTNTKAANECYDNAFEECEKGIGVKIVSGWVVNQFDPLTNSTAIVQHWWNIDNKGTYYDTTQNLTANLEYIVDSAISEYGRENFDELQDMVAASLLFQNNKFSAVRKINDELVYKSMPNLSTENIFRILPSE